MRTGKTPTKYNMKFFSLSLSFSHRYAGIFCKLRWSRQRKQQARLKWIVSIEHVNGLIADGIWTFLHTNLLVTVYTFTDCDRRRRQRKNHKCALSNAAERDEKKSKVNAITTPFHSSKDKSKKSRWKRR